MKFADNRYAEIVGWGKCLPPAVLTNQDLSTFLDTSDEWISSRTGIKARRIAHTNTSELAEVAAQHALATAGISAQEVDLIIVATASPDTLIPNIASKVQRTLGAKRAAAFDLNAACTGFLYSLEVATRMLQAGNYQHALVIGAERLTYYLNWAQRDTAVLFGDGAGAVVLKTTDKPVGLLDSRLGCDSDGRDVLAIPDYGTAAERFQENSGLYTFNFVGREIFKRAVLGMGQAVDSVLDAAGISGSDVDLVVPHQANMRIIDALCQKLGMSSEQAYVNIQNYGNTSAATIPIALCEAIEQKRVKPGAKIMTAAFGAGLTWGAGLIQWGDRVEPVNSCDAALPPSNKSALELLASAIDFCQSAAKD